jgi:hypothetical protein
MVSKSEVTEYDPFADMALGTDVSGAANRETNEYISGLQVLKDLR